MPKNYKQFPPKALYGDANAISIARVGVGHLNKAFFELDLPLYIMWNHIKTDIESLWEDGSLRNAVAYFLGKIKATGRDTTREILVPIVVREGHLLPPALFRSGESTDVLTKEAIHALFTGTQFPRPLPDREYMYGLPPLPGFGMPNRMMTDIFDTKVERGRR